MAFNNGFPMAYQPFYGNQGINYQPPMQTPPQGQNNGITWVSGEAGAKAYLVAPNNTVQLWDSEAQTIYLKSADASGMPTMKILDYTIRDAQPQQTTPIAQPVADYVTREEFNALAEKFNQLTESKKKGVKSDE
jgi:HAMP domain-containing protein